MVSTEAEDTVTSICKMKSFVHNPVTPSVAWLSISSRPPDESYTGVTVSVGEFGAANEAN